MTVDPLTVGVVLVSVLATVETLVLVMGNSMCGGIPFTLLKAKMRNKLIVEIENKDKSIDYIIPEVKEGYLQLQKYDIGSVLITPSKIVNIGRGVTEHKSKVSFQENLSALLNTLKEDAPDLIVVRSLAQRLQDGNTADASKVRGTRTGIRMLRVSPDLPEGFTGDDVVHGFIDSPQMIDRYNERMADRLQADKDPAKLMDKLQNAGVIAIVILTLCIGGYILIGKMSEWNTSSVCINALANAARVATTTLPPEAVAAAGNLTETGIY
jgi:hypothetical protein